MLEADSFNDRSSDSEQRLRDNKKARDGSGLAGVRSCLDEEPDQ